MSFRLAGMSCALAIVTIGAALAPRASADAHPVVTKFMGEPVWRGALPAKPHGELLRLATRLIGPRHVPALKSADAYAHWLNAEYGPATRRDQAELATLANTIETLSGDDLAFALVLVVFATDANLRFAMNADRANPDADMERSAGVGLDEHARRANQVVQLATACITATAAAAPPLSDWSARCTSLRVANQKIVDDECDLLTTIGRAEQGTFCGDRKPAKP